MPNPLWQIQDPEVWRPDDSNYGQPPIDYRGAVQPNTDLNVPRPNQTVDPYAKYDEMMNGPATQALMKHLGQFPAEQKPGVLDRIVASLAGGSAGWQEGPGAGLMTGQAYLDMPERRRVNRWQQENAPLQAASGIEARRAAHYLDPYKLAEMTAYHQGMLQRPLNLESMKESERQDRIKTGSASIDALPGVPERIKSRMKAKLFGAGGGWSEEAGTFKPETYMQRDAVAGQPKQTLNVMRNTKDPNLLYEVGSGRELSLKDLEGFDPYEKGQIFQTGEGNVGLASPRALQAQNPGAIVQTNTPMATPVTTTPDINPNTARLQGVTQTERSGKTRYVKAPAEATGVTKPLSDAEQNTRATLTTADSDLKVVESLAQNPKVKEYIGLGSGAKAGVAKFFGKAPKELSTMQAAANRLFAMIAHPVIGSAMTAPELALIRGFTSQIQNSQFQQDFFENLKAMRRNLDLELVRRGLKKQGETGAKSIEDLRKQYIDLNAPEAKSSVDDFVRNKLKAHGVE